MVHTKFLIVATALFMSCSSSDLPNEFSDVTTSTPTMPKILNTAQYAQLGQLIIYFSDDAVASIEQNVKQQLATRSTATRVGITPIDEIFSQIGVVSLHRVFPYNPKSEDRLRSLGMHKWYVVSFDDKVDLDKAAIELSDFSQIECIQFNSKMAKASDCKTYPLNGNSIAVTRAASKFNDPYLSKQWHYNNVADRSLATAVQAGADINADEAWNIETGNPNIIVAIVDEGVKYSHPDLAANMWVNSAELNGQNGVDDDNNGYIDDIYGYNFVSQGAISWDINTGNPKTSDSGHGTHVAGTVAAVNNNGIGVSGVAGGSGSQDGVRLMSCQVFSGSNGGTASVVAEAVRYAADQGASIIQCSFGYDSGTYTSDASYNKNKSVERAAIDYFIATKNCKAIDGSLAIFAAGNEGKSMPSYPGAYRNYICVTAFAPDFMPAYYTNYGQGCNIAAPGGEYAIAGGGVQSMVLSTLPSELNEGEDYGYMQGTSMACPHVSGVAALGLSYALKKGKSYTTDEFKSMLLTAVNDLEIYLDGQKTSGSVMLLSNYRKQLGTGAIDACQLLMQIDGTPCLKAKVGTKQLISLSNFFGGGSSSLTYLGVDMDAQEMQKLGLESIPNIQYGKLQVKCTKPGIARVKITAIAGGSALGSEENMGGMVITKEFAIIARGVQSTNGGWL